VSEVGCQAEAAVVFLVENVNCKTIRTLIAKPGGKFHLLDFFSFKNISVKTNFVRKILSKYRDVQN